LKVPEVEAAAVDAVAREVVAEDGLREALADHMAAAADILLAHHAEVVTDGHREVLVDLMEAAVVTLQAAKAADGLREALADHMEVAADIPLVQLQHPQVIVDGHLEVLADLMEAAVVTLQAAKAADGLQEALADHMEVAADIREALADHMVAAAEAVEVAALASLTFLYQSVLVARKAVMEAVAALAAVGQDREINGSN
jgi:hypothetical protein